VSDAAVELGPVLEGTAAAVQRSRSRAINLRPASILSIASDRMGATVVDDHSPQAAPYGAYIIAPYSFHVGERVMVLFQPPHGAYIVGLLRGGFTPWQILGPESGAGNFGTGWANDAACVFPENDGPTFVSVRRVGSLVELRGRATRVSGAGTTLAVLTGAFRPRSLLSFPTVVGPIAAVGVVVVHQGSGVIQPVTGTFDQGAGGYVNLDGIAFTVD